MAGKVVEATVMAAECCYGAELYDPSLSTAGGQTGMCNTYLARKAYGYFGSTNIAYGPSATVDQADLMCQYFLLEILGGAWTGPACLQARLKYVNKKGGVLTPTDLKTLAQFTLMADPSITPVSARPHGAVISSATGAKSLVAAEDSVARHARHAARRAGLKARAAVTTAYRLVDPSARAGKSAAFKKLLELAAGYGIKTPDVILSYVVGTASAPPAGAKAFAEAAPCGRMPNAVHVILKQVKPPKEVPHLKLVRGVQAIEYKEGMVAEAFESRWPQGRTHEISRQGRPSPVCQGQQERTRSRRIADAGRPNEAARAGGNPFKDPELEKLVGREIACDGEIHQGQLLMSRCNVLDE